MKIEFIRLNHDIVTSANDHNKYFVRAFIPYPEKSIWTYEFENESMKELKYYKNMVLVLTQDNSKAEGARLYALKRISGELKWIWSTDSPYDQAVNIVTNDQMIVVNTDLREYKINYSDGKLISENLRE